LRQTCLGCCVSAGLQTSHADDLVSHPDSDGEGAQSAGDDGVGALEWRADDVTVNPDKVGADEVVWQLLAGIVPRKRKNRSIYCGFEFINNVFNSNFIIFQ
jgi:hypothetical protein